MIDLYKVARLCREARRRNGVTQIKVAADMNYSPTNIAEYERGRNNNLLILLYYVQNFFLPGELEGFLRGDINDVTGNS